MASSRNLRASADLCLCFDRLYSIKVINVVGFSFLNLKGLPDDTRMDYGTAVPITLGCLRGKR